MADKNNWLVAPVSAPDMTFYRQAQQHQSQLTKPEGSLGRLEDLAIDFASFQGCVIPTLQRVRIVVFAADHGVTAQGVSAFPAQVTQQMLNNFAAGGAAINVLSRALDAELNVVNLGLMDNQSIPESVYNRVIAEGTQNFVLQPAMTPEQCSKALLVGREFAQQKQDHLLIGGDMGIGNTTAAAALYSVILDLPPQQCVGPGTGVDAQGLANKAHAIEQALVRHSDNLSDTLSLLQCFGGFEIAALTGFYIAAAQKQIPVLVDGFICTAAALVAVQLNPSVREWLLFAHQSAEPAHAAALQYLKAKPLVDLQMRLGEGSGAAVVVPIIKLALSLHEHMATFTSAGVADGKTL